MNDVSHALKKPTLSLYFAIGLFAVGLVILLFAAGLQGAPQSDTAPQPTIVTTDKVHIQQGFDTPVSLYGLIESAQASQLAFDTTGQVISILVDEGDSVGQGQIIAKLDEQRLVAKRGELSAALDRANANLTLAQLSEERITNLVDKKLEASQRLDEATASTKAALAQVSEIEAAINSLNVGLTKTTLTAPFSGIISRRFVDEGEVLSAGMPVLSITNQHSPQVRIAVPADMLDYFPPGESIAVTLNQKELRGKVVQHLPVRDRQTRTVDVLVSLPRGLRSRPGDMASIAGSKHHKEVGSWVPVSALSNGVRGLWRIFVVDTDSNILQGRSIEVLYSDREQAFVRGALADGERYVTTGTHKLAPGQRVSVQASSLMGAPR